MLSQLAKWRTIKNWIQKSVKDYHTAVQYYNEGKYTEMAILLLSELKNKELAQGVAYQLHLSSSEMAKFEVALNMSYAVLENRNTLINDFKSVNNASFDENVM